MTRGRYSKPQHQWDVIHIYDPFWLWWPSVMVPCWSPETWGPLRAEQLGFGCGRLREFGAVPPVHWYVGFELDQVGPSWNGQPLVWRIDILIQIPDNSWIIRGQKLLMTWLLGQIPSHETKFTSFIIIQPLTQLSTTAGFRPKPVPTDGTVTALWDLVWLGVHPVIWMTSLRNARRRRGWNQVFCETVHSVARNLDVRVKITAKRQFIHTLLM